MTQPSRWLRTATSPRAVLSPRIATRRAMTLVEVLLAVTITLIILLVMLRVFRVTSHDIALGRATLAMAERNRDISEILRRDLSSLTVPARPWTQNSESNGYFEYVEGPWRENDFTTPIDSYLGDWDDVLAMTVRATDRPFRGRYDHDNDPSTTPAIIESYIAEVVWWTVRSTNDVAVPPPPPLPPANAPTYAERITLYRRVLLVRPDLPAMSTSVEVFFQNNDLSARSVGGQMVMNSLSDLTRRECRFGHEPVDLFPFDGNNDGFPHEIARQPIPLNPNAVALRPLTGDLEGDDVVATDIAAFDIRIFSPDAAIEVADDRVVEPSDPGLATTPGSLAEGAYVDLGFLNVAFGTGGPWFSELPHPSSQLNTLTTGDLYYCTWSPHYEVDGIDQNGGGIDEGANGIDDDGANGVDDNGERETQPPYPYAVRAMSVTVRLLDRGTGQLHQTTTKHAFVPD
jgi:hypothetical protein